MILHQIACALGDHICKTKSDEIGIWGECVMCRRRFGFVSRATLRARADRDLARHLNSGGDT